VSDQAIDLDSLIERVAALKHDLGKYVAWTSANLEERVWTGPLDDEWIDALRADLLETRKSGDRRDAAWEVWAAHRVGLPEPLEPIGPVLRESVLGENQRETLARERANIRAAQQDIRNALRDLHRRLLQER
jgi:hypothetical protein